LSNARLGRLLTVWTLAVLTLCGTLVAQTTPVGNAPQEGERTATPRPAETVSKPASTTPSAAQQTVPAAPGAAPPLNIIYVPDEQGRPVPIPVGVTLKELLRQLQERRTVSPPKVEPGYSISRISLEGEIIGERADLTARLQLEVTDAEGGVVVPLRMGEGVLRDFTHEGPGSAEFDSFDPEAGHRWRIKGAGRHTLSLMINMPVRRELPTRRLQLSLPPAAVSDLKLRIPQTRLTARTDERSKVTTTTVDDQHTLVTVIGLGQRLDLSWQPQVDLNGVETVLEARTSMSVSLDGESVMIEATQRIRPLQGSFSEVLVRLPAGFELLKLEGTAYKEHRAADNLNQVLVTLKESTNAAVDLRWTLRSELENSFEPILLEGFEVDRARIQTGHLAVRVLGAYVATRFGDDDRFVQRLNVSDVARLNPPIPAQGEISSAYQFFRQPFRLMMKLEKLEPYITVEPFIQLNLSADRAELEGTFKFQVSRGTVEEVLLNWPGWKEEGWSLDPVEPARLVEQTLEGAADGSIRVRLTSRTAAAFELKLRARRSLEPENGPLPISFPAAQASSQLPTVAVIAMADNVEADFKPTGETSARPTSQSLLDTLPVAREATDSRRMSFWVNPGTQTFTVNLTVHKRRVLTQTEADVHFEGTQLGVTQRIIYDVAYERLGHVMLSGPPQLIERCRFLTGTGVELLPTSVGLSEAGRQEIRLTLDQPRIGRFEIVAEYFRDELPPMAGEPGDVQLSLLQSTDAEYSQTQIRVHHPPGFQVDLAERGWKRQVAGNAGGTWLAEGSKADVPLTFERQLTPEQQRVNIPRALIHARFDAQGGIYCRAQYRLINPPAPLHLRLPGEAQGIRFWWNALPLTSEQVRMVSETPGDYELGLPGDAFNDEHLLTIEYSLSGRQPLGASHRNTFPVPQITGDPGVTQTCWELVLPYDHHLFTVPTGFVPLFHWERQGVVWGRVNRQTPEEVATWMGANDGPVEPTTFVGRNSYRFSSFGVPPSFQFRTIRRHIAVLIGAGTALLVAFVLIYVPVTRHVLTLLLLGFLTAVAALWYSEPVLVLLQPAVLGILLALASVAIQAVVRRSRQSRTLTLSSPSGFMTPASSMQQELGLGQETTSLPVAAIAQPSRMESSE